MALELDEETLAEILSVSNLGIRSVKSKKGSTESWNCVAYLIGCLLKTLTKEFLRKNFSCCLSLQQIHFFLGLTWRLFWLVLIMFLMKIFFKYKVVSLPAIIIEHMNFVLNDKDRRYGLPYDLWLTRVFAYFNIERGKMQVQSAKWKKKELPQDRKCVLQMLPCRKRMDELETQNICLKLLLESSPTWFPPSS